MRVFDGVQTTTASARSTPWRMASNISRSSAKGVAAVWAATRARACGFGSATPTTRRRPSLALHASTWAAEMPPAPTRAIGNGAAGMVLFSLIVESGPGRVGVGSVRLRRVHHRRKSADIAAFAVLSSGNVGPAE